MHFYQEIAVAFALLLLLIEAIFVFRPLERKVKHAINEIENKNTAIQAALDASEALNKTKYTFLSSVSHELRTPLNAIIGFSEALILGVYGKIASKKQHARLGDINAAAKHLLGLVNDILLLRATDAQELHLEEGETRVDALLADVTALLQPLAENAGVHLSFSEKNASLRLWVDERRMQQILLNIINNAIKYTPEGGQIDIWAGRLDSGEVAFRVTDTGIGMTRDEVAMAREMFQRIETEYTRAREGSGLGLPVSIELAHAHGGRIDIASEKGVGTEVTVVLPASRGVDARADAAA